MNHTRRGLIAAVLLIIAIGNYSRIDGSEQVRTVVFLQIFAIGALTAVTIREVMSRFKNKKQ